MNGNNLPPGTASPYPSPILSKLREADADVGAALNSACGDCPISVWHCAGDNIDDLKCFCPALHQITWTESGAAIKLCDAREHEIVAYKARTKDLERRPEGR